MIVDIKVGVDKLYLNVTLLNVKELVPDKMKEKISNDFCWRATVKVATNSIHGNEKIIEKMALETKF